MSVLLPNLPALRLTFGDDVAQHILSRTCAKIMAFAPESIVGQGQDDRVMMTYEYDPEWTDLADVAADLLEAIDHRVPGSDVSLPAACVVGAATHRAGGPRGSALDVASELLRQAELAADLSAKQSEVRFCVYSEQHDAQIRNATILEQHLRRAIARHEFVLHYQPTVDLRTLDTVALEALVRWRSSVGELRFPDEFIPAAETNGLIVQIGSDVLDIAVRQLSAWAKEGWSPGKLAVNISAAQLMDRDFPAFVSQLLDREGVNPRSLELEVTERTLIAEPQSARSLLADLRSRGISVALDDFGVGYSSLQYLRDLPISKLKIDRSFVCGVEKGGRDAALVQSVVSLGEALGLEVVAEGIETEAQLRALRDCGCNFGQGYLFSEPRPAMQVASTAAILA
jgi:EAL domain-containing protein (putative c-di-GMP-specific phosphodiesterase class I)